MSIERNLHGKNTSLTNALSTAKVEKIYQIKLTDEEKGMLAKSAASVQELVDVLKTKF